MVLTCFCTLVRSWLRSKIFTIAFSSRSVQISLGWLNRVIMKSKGELVGRITIMKELLSQQKSFWKLSLCSMGDSIGSGTQSTDLQTFLTNLEQNLDGQQISLTGTSVKATAWKRIYWKWEFRRSRSEERPALPSFAVPKKILSYFLHWIVFTHELLRQMFILFFSRHNIWAFCKDYPSCKDKSSDSSAWNSLLNIKYHIY